MYTIVVNLDYFNLFCVQSFFVNISLNIQRLFADVLLEFQGLCELNNLNFLTLQMLGIEMFVEFKVFPKYLNDMRHGTVVPTTQTKFFRSKIVISELSNLTKNIFRFQGLTH